MSRPIAIVAFLALAATDAACEEALKNWFKDPYFQVRSAIPGCAQPLGPYTTHEQMLKETHYRSERGTRCWLEGKCAKPSSYLYDPEIAAAVRSRFESSAKLRDATLWVTVQRRWVWVEGCVRSTRDRETIEALMKGVPDMELLIVNAKKPGDTLPPYRTPAPGQVRADD